MMKAQMDKAQILTMTKTACHLKMILDTTVIEEEEDWIEYITRKDGICEDSVLEQDSHKNEMEIGTENSNMTEREMVEANCRIEHRTQLKIQDQQSDWETKKKMGRRHQRIHRT